MRHNAVIREYYQRLLAACMRKLLVILHRMLRTSTLWAPDFAST